ncbi:AAA family ATPase [Acinetobacter sp.]|uniref:AAA family ATPase n=1 Tax=Acinetobacter sp. TaxID=472 RepID=UPI0035B15AF1
MTEKIYYWAENLEGYSSDNEKDYDQIIEIKRLNFFIGKNNAGKSRFLRHLFFRKKGLFSYNINLMDFDEFIEISDIVKNNQNLRKKIYHDRYASSQVSRYTLDSNAIPTDDFFKLLDIIDFFSKNSYLETEDFTKHSEKISNLTHYDIDESYTLYNLIQKLMGKFSQFKTTIPFSYTNKKYIPTLRGLRPIVEQSEQLFPYLNRTFFDYIIPLMNYNKSSLINYNESSLEKEKALYKRNILTGENFYENLTKFRNGQEHQWQVIEDYQNTLSHYFFNNERIVIIPIHDDNIPHIKIGSEPQFPISQLGDGLQQVIILTYEAFINKNQIYEFFIEEPELHMHAGMVRQLMNFYLNETKHYYFFTTHSNHLLDMADESDQVIIQKFVKEPKGNSKDFDFKIYRCDRDHELLTSLGVKPSSVYLANCTIWVEGVTDRMYIAQYMKKYLQELLETNNKTQEEINEDLKKHKKYLGFMPNFHYAFVEYAGGNITHWSFMDDYATKEEALEFLENNQGLTAKAITQNILLLADGDNEGKADRLNEWKTELKQENVYILPCKEIENTLDPSIIYKASLIKFQGISKTHQQITLHADTNSNLNTKGFNARTDTSEFDINQLTDSINYISDFGIGKIIDDVIRIDNTPKLNAQNEPIPLSRLLSDKSGTIDDKVSFCEISKVLMRYEGWQLTPKAKELCERIFGHIEKCNK